MKDHFRAFKAAGAPNLQEMPLNTKVDNIREGLKHAIDMHSAGKWKLYGEESESGEELEDLDDGDDDKWEDDDSNN